MKKDSIFRDPAFYMYGSLAFCGVLVGGGMVLTAVGELAGNQTAPTSATVTAQLQRPHTVINGKQYGCTVKDGRANVTGCPTPAP
ncbi:MAG: hypothetical protein WCD70_04385 [Alphaproteobacteria bacterium]